MKLKTQKEIFEEHLKANPDSRRALEFMDRERKEAIKRAKHYKKSWLETGDYYYKGMLDAELFANNLTLEDLEK